MTQLTRTTPGQLFADVALALPGLGTFQYSIPESLREKAAIGKRANVLVRTRPMIGYITGLSSEKAPYEVRDIASVIDEAAVLDKPLLELTRWVSEHYLCSWGQAIEAALPAAFKKGKFFMKSRLKKKTPDLVDPEDLRLTESQKKAYERVRADIDARKTGVFLLHGITGSGKTEVYMHLIRETLARGRSGIVLVPEISLTPQTVDRFCSRFGDCVAVIHSRLSQGQRVEEWHRIRSGQARVVVGARSGVFSPMKDLGLIVIDEEHDTSYKQEETPRYQTREVAKKRAELENAVLVLGSATPSLEAYHASEAGAVCRLTLPERIEKRPLPVVEIVDMRRQEGGGERLFSNILVGRIQDSLARKEQAMLLLNRRGFSTYLHCASCGYVMTCEHCRISLAYHFDKSALLCHLCHFRTQPVRLCPGCGKSYLHYFGSGTQKAEAEAVRLFPSAKIARMDYDSTSRKDAHEEILRAFKKKEIDILIGTQMIAKGHDFPNVSLVGVISADTALHIPDFRAAERTFDLLTQVAGRAGRGDVAGKVVVQTYVPHHYAIRHAKDHDYVKFYGQEMVFRRELAMPPCAHLIKVIFSGAQEKEVVKQILLFKKLLETKAAGGGHGILGPAPGLISKEKGLYRWNLFLKHADGNAASALLRQAIAEFKKSGVAIAVDVDPQ